MLVNPSQMILEAQKVGYAIGAFNTSDLEITKAIINAAIKLNSPVIVQTSEKAIAYAGLNEIAAIVIAQAKDVKIPIALNLDHGSSLDLLHQCIETGYTAVMFDGSKLNLTENKIFTRQAVEMAKRHGVACEGELGSLSDELTNPNDVADFVKETGLDFLATSIGSKHGVEAEEKLNIELLKEIRKRTDVPLVLHGASGVSKEDIKAAIESGICKINIDTDIRHTFSKTIRDLASKLSENTDPRQLMQKVMLAIQSIVEEKILLFGSANKVK